MNDKEKINTIGRILADVNLNTYIIRNQLKIIKDYLIDEDKLKFEKYWKKSNEDSV